MKNERKKPFGSQRVAGTLQRAMAGALLKYSETVNSEHFAMQLWPKKVSGLHLTPHRFAIPSSGRKRFRVPLLYVHTERVGRRYIIPNFVTIKSYGEMSGFAYH